MSKVKWISIKHALPNHTDNVLVINKSGGMYVVMFVDNEHVFQTLRMNNIMCSDEDREGYEFCSKEISGNVLKNVTHWMPLPEIPK